MGDGSLRKPFLRASFVPDDRSQDRTHSGANRDALSGVAAVVVSDDPTGDSTEESPAEGLGSEQLGSGWNHHGAGEGRQQERFHNVGAWDACGELLFKSGGEEGRLAVGRRVPLVAFLF
jgi:hypothetical protein